eukprot:TRINITY_DN6138_c0_g1_i2.p1 TRINITY_DN6138_c0_g1~~TRINITY_DN6138_c0_g1_i2.p1  ORF type:complete len:239 (+),score=15.07 TRINITY_DN6138_c0_g1_i2:327-1043(+)
MGGLLSVPQPLPECTLPKVVEEKYYKTTSDLITASAIGTDTPHRKLTFVLISDTHGHHEKLVVPDGDVLLVVGDTCMRANSGKKFTRAFGDWLISQPHRVKVVVAGNHETGLTDSPKRAEANSRLFFGQNLPNGVFYLQDSVLDITHDKCVQYPYVNADVPPKEDGVVRIFGYPHVRNRNPFILSNAFARTLTDRRNILRNNTTNDIDIFLSHPPPVGVGGVDGGCSALTEWLGQLEV